jgi:hypothetical protein
VFDKYEGFETSTLYPGYSADFFDTHHNVVVRGLDFGYCFLLLTALEDWGVVCDDATYCGTPRAAQLVPTQLSVRVDRWPSCVRCEGVNWLNNETESVRGEEKYSELYLCKLLSLPPMSALVECRYSMLLLYE